MGQWVKCEPLSTLDLASGADICCLSELIYTYNDHISIHGYQERLIQISIFKLYNYVLFRMTKLPVKLKIAELT